MSIITHTREVASTTLQYANFLIFTPETHTQTHTVCYTQTQVTRKHLKNCQWYFTPTTSNQTPWFKPYRTLLQLTVPACFKHHTQATNIVHLYKPRSWVIAYYRLLPEKLTNTDTSSSSHQNKALEVFQKDHRVDILTFDTFP